MTEFSVQDDLLLATDLADAADILTMARFRATDLVIEDKADLTPVTEADRAVERTLANVLMTRRPTDARLGEEFGGVVANAGRTWIIDPIDGTKNYVRGVPVWATLIALVCDGAPLVGVVSAPAMGRRWWAATSLGAFTSDPDGARRPCRVSKVGRLEDASFSYSDAIGWDRHNGTALDTFLTRCWRARAYGDFWSHMLVAEGAVDIAAEPELSPWDLAALVPVVLEAGGSITGYDGKPALQSDSAVTTNGHLHAEALRITAAVAPLHRPV